MLASGPVVDHRRDPAAPWLSVATVVESATTGAVLASGLVVDHRQREAPSHAVIAAATALAIAVNTVEVRHRP